MNKREVLKRAKGLLAFVLAFMVMFGMPMQVLAKDIPISSLSDVSGVKFEGLDVVQLSGGFLKIDNVEVAGPDEEYTLPEGKTYRLVGTEDDNGYFVIKLSTKGTSETGKPQENYTASGGTHEHILGWKLTLEPTETTDGRYDYRCECGYSEGTQPVSFLTVVVDNIIRSIESAPADGTVLIENRFLRCLTDEMMEALKKRPDVSLEVRFTDKEVPYKFVIPAGQYPAEESEWYGYYYLGSIYGWKES